LGAQYGIITVPTMFIVDKDGRCVNRAATLADVKAMYVPQSQTAPTRPAAVLNQPAPPGGGVKPGPQTAGKP
jgi:hypothetical protein